MAAPKKFGTFGGVFTPTLLTILGVIMYLRLGWVVIYSSLKKMKDVGEFSSIINYNIESNTIKVNEVDGRNSISVPIFYTHGKIGHVILNVKL